LEILFGPLRQFAGLPLASLLYEWDAIAAQLVLFADEDGVAFPCDEDIIFFVNGDTILGENGNGAIVGCFPTLISDEGNSSNVSAWAAFGERF